MKIEHKSISIREIVNNYFDDAENGVRGYNNLLNIRPAYQREFVYKDKQRDAVINTIYKGFGRRMMMALLKCLMVSRELLVSVNLSVEFFPLMSMGIVCIFIVLLTLSRIRFLTIV